MTQPSFVLRWLRGLGVILALVGLISQGTAGAQTSLIDLRKAADQDDAIAQYLLGQMYASGKGVPEDFTQAAIWFLKAAYQGHANAQYTLGLNYATGRGVPADDAQAVTWYRKAANQGHANAQYNLAFMYATALGVPQDDVEALKWQNLAVFMSRGDDKKRHANGRDVLKERMTRAQLAEAQRRATEWQAAFEKKQLDSAVDLEEE